MGRNLPPGVSVSDLPGNGPTPDPECVADDCSALPDEAAMADGYPLCEDHDTPEARHRHDQTMKRRREEAERKAAAEERRRALEREQPPRGHGTPEVFLDDEGDPRDEEQRREDMEK